MLQQPDTRPVLSREAKRGISVALAITGLLLIACAGCTGLLALLPD